MKKPGWKTTEFWLALLALILGAVAASGLLDLTDTPLDNKAIGLALSGLATLGYGAARAFTKVGEARADAIASLPPSAP